MAKDHYTFGDSDEASVRLRRLAELYEPETRLLLQRSRVQGPELAIDLGCGPGWSTNLLQKVLNPGRTVGLDTSERYIVQARRTHGPSLEFQVHDITRSPFPLKAPDVMFCRFLLTHLTSLQDVLTLWAETTAPNAMLFIHETETLETDDPTLRRYYELVAQLQRHYGQALFVGVLLEESLERSGWRLLENQRPILEKPVAKMAQLHLSNLHTWRQDEYARQTFDAAEIDSLEASLTDISEDSANKGIVINAARQIIAQRR
jgi:trans-aconitate 2-methyltransferase